jgi:hypothetical protein
MTTATVPVVRIYSGSDGESHFEDLEVPLKDLGEIGAISDRIPATGLLMRTTGADYDFSWHNAPQRQYVIMLSGGDVEIEVGDGTKRRLSAGDILLAEDTTGRGHISRAVDDRPRLSLFVTLE